MDKASGRSVKNTTRTVPNDVEARVLAMLDQAPTTRGCLASTRAAFAAQGTVSRHPAGSAIHRIGEAMAELILVVDGIMEVSRLGAGGKRHVVSFASTGTAFGLIPVLDGQGCTHDTWAHDALTLLRVPRRAVLAGMSGDPAFLESALGLLCERSRVLYGELTAQALLPLRVRTARAVRTLAGSYGVGEGPRQQLALRITQDDLADMLGVTRQSVNRELKALEREGTIRLGKSELEVLDRVRLTRAADAAD